MDYAVPHSSTQSLRQHRKLTDRICEDVSLDRASSKRDLIAAARFVRSTRAVTPSSSGGAADKLCLVLETFLPTALSLYNSAHPGALDGETI